MGSHTAAAVQLIQIFLADGRTDKGVPRGPRGPKKCADDSVRVVSEAILSR